MPSTPTLEQATAERMAEFLDVARSGITELTGKGIREYGKEGAFVGRHKGIKPGYREYRGFHEGPKQLAAAIARGRGRLFRKIRRATRAEMARQGFEDPPKRPRPAPAPKIEPHEGKPYCIHCRVRHTRGQHRFHGPGSFHGTHLFSFNPKEGRVIPRAKFFKTIEGGRRPYLINSPAERVKNPHVIIANPKQKGTSMASIRMRRNRKGQFVARASNPRKKRGRKRNWMSAGAVVPNRRRGHRRRKHNPPASFALPLPLLGRVEFPPISTVLGVSAGLAGPPIVEGFARRFAPTMTAQYPTLTTIGAHGAVLAGGYMIGGRKGLRDVAVGEVAGVVVKLITKFFAGGFGNGMQGYIRPTTRGQMSGHGVRGYVGPVSRRQLTALPRLNGIGAMRGRGLRGLGAASGSRFSSRFRPA